MKYDNLNNISISRIREYLPSEHCIGVDDDFFVVDVTYREPFRTLTHPCRLDGCFALFCIRGGLRMTVNMNEFELNDNMLFFGLPGNIIKFEEMIGDTPEKDRHYVIMAMSKEFMSSLRVDIGKVFNDGMSFLDRPCLHLSAKEAAVAGKYLDLIADVVNSDIPSGKAALTSLMSSLFYTIAGMCAERMEARRTAVPVQSTRSRMVFEQFIRLVSEHHTVHRNVGFYADKLCLTPKYLSKLIKTASGRSAPEWIDSYVILEAKNLLKYSGIAIKEIVYRLNFPNQSVFYKFFKARTGMTPSEYRNS